MDKESQDGVGSSFLFRWIFIIMEINGRSQTTRFGTVNWRTLSFLASFCAEKIELTFSTQLMKTIKYSVETMIDNKGYIVLHFCLQSKFIYIVLH